jgi:hypothetical protein
MSYESKLNTFFTILNEELDLPDNAKKVIKNAMLKAGFNKVETVEVEKTKRKLTGYNLFVRQQMEENKGNTMATIAVVWKKLSKKETDIWNVKAGQVENVVKVKAPRKPTGYNLFTKEIMPSVKENKKVVVGDRLKEIGKLWQELSDEEKNLYNQRANGTQIKKVKQQKETKVKKQKETKVKKQKEKEEKEEEEFEEEKEEEEFEEEKEEEEFEEEKEEEEFEEEKEEEEFEEEKEEEKNENEEITEETAEDEDEDNDEDEEEKKEFSELFESDDEATEDF